MRMVIKRPWTQRILVHVARTRWCYHLCCCSLSRIRYAGTWLESQVANSTMTIHTQEIVFFSGRKWGSLKLGEFKNIKDNLNRQQIWWHWVCQSTQEMINNCWESIKTWLKLPALKLNEETHIILIIMADAYRSARSDVGGRNLTSTYSNYFFNGPWRAVFLVRHLKWLNFA